jgi:hypothetical protein
MARSKQELVEQIGELVAAYQDQRSIGDPRFDGRVTSPLELAAYLVDRLELRAEDPAGFIDGILP